MNKTFVEIDESAVRVALEIDRDQYDYLAALAALRGKTASKPQFGRA